MSDGKPHDDEEDAASSDEAPASAEDSSEDPSEDPSEELAEAPGEDPGEDPGEGPAQDDEDEDEGLELDDLDAMGVDGVLAGLRAADAVADDDEDLEPIKRSGPRSPWISMVVMAFAAYLLVTMFADFRYWIGSSQPEDLGHATDWIADGQVPAGYHNRFVLLEGTPDVQNAARLSTESNYVGYLRITEGEGRLFAAVPRSKKQDVGLRFSGRFEGRMVRLSQGRAWPWLEQFFTDNPVTRNIDSTPEGLVSALQQRAGDGLTIETAEGPVTVMPSERVRLVAKRGEARVQLGAESFRAKAAQEAVAALGYPFVKVDSPGTFHQFIVRLPDAQREAVRRELEATLEKKPDPADPKEGVAVLPMTATFTMLARDLAVQGETFSFPIGDNTASPGYQEQGGALVERDLAGGPMQVAASELAAVRVEKVIELDPDGYLIVVGAKPADYMKTGLAWLVVLGIALANLLALYLGYRRRQKKAALAPR